LFLLINCIIQCGFPHLRATSMCPNILRYAKVRI